MAEQQRRPRAKIYTTPKGVAVFPWITRPDTRFNSDGVYQTGLRLSEEDAAEIVNAISEAHAKNLEEVKAKNKGKKVREADLPIQDELDEEGNVTGNVMARFKLNAQFTGDDGKVIKTQPSIFDAKGTKIELDSLWGGSLIKVAFSIHPFYTATVGAGVTLRLRGVQVIKLAAGSGGNAESFGFGAEDGYEADSFGGDSGTDNDSGSSGTDNEDF